MSGWGKKIAGLLTLGFLGFFAGCSGGESSVATSSSSDGTIDASNLSLGDIEEVDLSGASATLNFNSSDNSQYYLVVNTSPTPSSSSYTFQMTKDISSGALTADELAALTFEEEETPGDESQQFHEFLREFETEIIDSNSYEEVPTSSQSGLMTALAVGDSKTFRVLSTVSSTSAYKEVVGKLRYISDDLHVYVDDDTSGNISDADLTSLASNFESIAMPRERELFGDETDINSDGHVTILMTPVVNQMVTSGGIVTGFFFPGDLYQRTALNPASNAREIFYTLIPDPSGTYGTAISSTFATKNILPGVLAHEFQHMISFGQHVLRHGGSTEEPWLNECLSHLSEDLTGFGNENASKAKLFLSQPSKTSLIPVTSPGLSERGACYLFIRYMYEQSDDGDAFIQRLLDTNKTGVNNLENAFDGNDPEFDQMSEFIRRWTLTLALSETGITSNTKYNYETRTTHPVTKNLMGTCVRCNAQDGRGTTLAGPTMTTLTNYPAAASIKGTATQFYLLKNPSGTIQLGTSGNKTMSGSLIKLNPTN